MAQPDGTAVRTPAAHLGWALLVVVVVLLLQPRWLWQTLLLHTLLRAAATAAAAACLPALHRSVALACTRFSHLAPRARRLGVRDVLADIVSLYGTADAGVIGNETPLSVAIRRWLAAHPGAAAELFGAQRLPTLVQYDPFSRLVETHPEDGGWSCFGGGQGGPNCTALLCVPAASIRCSRWGCPTVAGCCAPDMPAHSCTAAEGSAVAAAAAAPLWWPQAPGRLPAAKVSATMAAAALVFAGTLVVSLFSQALSRHGCYRLLFAGTLVVSSIATPHTAAPLRRYCIGDAGGTVSSAGGERLGVWRGVRGGCASSGVGGVCAAGAKATASGLRLQSLSL